MKSYVKQHEAYIKECIKNREASNNLLSYHEKRIEWLAHERLVHLLVFLFTLASLLTFFVIALVFGEVWSYLIVSILLIVSVFYCLHYFFLENSIQRWYDLSNQIEELLHHKNM